MKPAFLRFFGGEIVSVMEMSGTFSVHTMELPAPCPAHSHDFLEAACIRRGWTLHTVNGVTRRLEEGDVVLVDFGEVHSFDGGSADLLVTNCLFQPVLLDPSLASCRAFPALLDSCLPGLGLSCGAAGEREKVFRDREGRVRAVLDRMREETLEQNVGWYAMLRVLLMSLIVEAVRLIGLQVPARPGVETSWILEEIRRDAAADHSLTAYARRFSMRPEALSRLFRRETGEGFAAYLRRQRIALACRLLLETQDSVSLIAERCGYLDGKAFREAFRRTVGMSPRAYRRDRPPVLLRLL